MKKNLDIKNYEIFNNFENKIASLQNLEDIIEETNVFCKSISVIDIINNLLESFSADRYYVPHNSVHNKITLFTSSNYEFSLIHNPPKKQGVKGSIPLYTYTNNVFFCPLISVPDSGYTIYEQTKSLAPDVLDTDAGLDTKTKSHFVKNKTISLRKFKDVLNLDETKPLLLLMIASKKSSLKYSWEYNSSTLKPTRIVLRDIHMARLGATAKILGNIGDVDSKRLLLKLAKHESHIVRWEAARSMININFDEGVLMLDKMTQDPHVELQLAASKSLQMLAT